MEEKKYTILLADGTKFENAGLNGNNYIVNGDVDASVFDGNCSPLVIGDGENTEVHDHAELVQAQKHEGETWLVFRDLTSAELREMRLRADVEYIAMMADVELED